MAEVIRHEDVGSNSSGLGFLLGTLLVLGLLAMLFFWGLPTLRGGGQTNIQNNPPAQGTNPGVNINVPQPQMQTPQQ